MWEVWNQHFCWTLLSCPLTECHNNGVLLTWLLLVLHLLLGPEEGMYAPPYCIVHLTPLHCVRGDGTDKHVRTYVSRSLQACASDIHSV